MSTITKKILLILIITIPIFVLDGYLIFSANHENILSDAIIQNIDTEIAKDIEKNKIQNSIQTTNVERQMLDKYFIDQEGEVSFVDNLEKLADRSGVVLEIDSATFDNYKNASSSSIPVELVNIHLKSTGTWSAVIGFWTLLESTPYRLDVSRIDLEKGDNIKGVSIWNLSVDIVVYKKK